MSQIFKNNNICFSKLIAFFIWKIYLHLLWISAFTPCFYPLDKDSMSCTLQQFAILHWLFSRSCTTTWCIDMKFLKCWVKVRLVKWSNAMTTRQIRWLLSKLSEIRKGNVTDTHSAPYRIRDSHNLKHAIVYCRIWYIFTLNDIMFFDKLNFLGNYYSSKVNHFHQIPPSGTGGGKNSRCSSAARQRQPV